MWSRSCKNHIKGIKEQRHRKIFCSLLSLDQVIVSLRNFTIGIAQMNSAHKRKGFKRARNLLTPISNPVTPQVEEGKV